MSTAQEIFSDNFNKAVDKAIIQLLVQGYTETPTASAIRGTELILHPTESSLGRRVQLRMRCSPLKFNVGEFFMNMPKPRQFSEMRLCLSEESQQLLRLAFALDLGHIQPIVIFKPHPVQPVSMGGIVWLDFEYDVEKLKEALEEFESATQSLKIDADRLNEALKATKVVEKYFEEDPAHIRYQKEQNKLRAKYHSRKR